MTQEEKSKINLDVKNAIANYNWLALKEMAKANDYALGLIISHLLVNQENMEHIKNILNN